VYVREFDLEPERGDDYIHPPRGCGDELDSFDYQSSKTNSGEHVDSATYKRALSRMEDVYAAAKWQLQDDFLSEAHLDRVIDTVFKESKKKSPGAVLLREGCPTNEIVFQRYGKEGVKDMLKRRLTALFETSDTRQVSDPLRIFIKEEAHKKAKAVEKRWRLIFGMSLIDQLVDRLLYTSVCEAGIANCADLPSKVGYNFKRGGVDGLVRKYSNGSKLWISFDAKGFDLSCGEQLLCSSRELNERLCVYDASDDGARERFAKWRDLSVRREQAVLYGSMVFSNGVVIQKTAPCIQPSGRYTTIDSNSKMVTFMRVYDDVAQGRTTVPTEVVAMGDDTVQDGLPIRARLCNASRRRGALPSRSSLSKDSSRTRTSAQWSSRSRRNPMSGCRCP